MGAMMKRRSYRQLSQILHEQNLQIGTILNYSSGTGLDHYGQIFAEMKRKKWWIFKESDDSFKARMLEHAMIERGILRSLEDERQ